MAATALRAEGDSTPGSDGGERITRLFPKCRPKGMHHHDRVGSGVETRLEANNSVSSDEERRERDPQLLILNSKGSSYKLRDSRIIEIAGGRELYSQSRTKAVRKLRHSTHKHNLRNKARVLTHDVDHSIDNKSGISIHRINNEPKKMVSRHTSPTYTNGDTLESSLAIPRNSSPILDPHKTNDVSAKSSPIAVVADGEVVVFDDNEDWKGLRLDPDASDNDIDATVRRTLDNIKNGDSDVMNNKNEISGSESSASREEVGCGVWASGDEERGRVRVIGELPIAEYEGSPRRYGIGTQLANQSTNRSPRPGFPQRVVTESREPTPPSSSTAFDYLYEFSETRKVLEEFFRCPTGAANTLPAANNDEIVNFQELDYELRRQSGDCRSDNDAEGSEGEWPAPDTLDSPHTAHNHTNFLGLQQQRERYAEPNMSELTVGAAWSGSASPAPAPANTSTVAVVRRERTQFALSPETSDCDSHGELDSDLSLMLMENELSELKGIVESGRSGGGAVVVSLPVVEDGLSSGHASDTDNNNQLNSLQTHTSVIIEEVIDNETSNETHVLSDADLHSLDPLACNEVSPPPPAPAPHRPEEPSEPLPLNTIPPRDTHETHEQHQTLQTLATHETVYNARKRPTSAQSAESAEIKPASGDEDEADTDLETDRLLGQQRTDDQGFFDDKGWRKPKSRTVMPAGGACSARTPPHAPLDDVRDDDTHHANKEKEVKKKNKNKEVLIEGVLFRARYLGSTQLACEGQPTKATRMLQAEEAVSRIKALAPEGENQPSTEVDLFISTEKIMVLNTELKEIMMDHALRTISYIADIGDLVVLMARRRFVPQENDSDQPKLNRTPKMICHVFESEEAQFIAQSIGQAFQVAYMEFLKANGIEDHSFVKEMDYQEVLNSQEIFGDELQMFAKKELQKEVVVPKTKGEILGVVVVESGWGSMLPTVVIANLAPSGAAARCGQLNIGDQIIAINGVSLVGLPLSTCQTYIKNSKNQTVVKLTVVPCAPVVEVKIKRPDTKYQLGFSVQNGVICSLLRGGIAERGGVRVGHRIIEINSQSVVAVPHERIVNLLATSVGEILMKTMPTSMFRLLTGQENPVFI